MTNIPKPTVKDFPIGKKVAIRYTSGSSVNRALSGTVICAHLALDVKKDCITIKCMKTQENHSVYVDEIEYWSSLESSKGSPITPPENNDSDSMDYLYLREKVHNAMRYIETLGDEWNHSEIIFVVKDAHANLLFRANIDRVRE